LSLKSESSWPWSSYFDRTFNDPDFPFTSVRSASWDEVFAKSSVVLDGHNFIKEIYVNDRHLIKPDSLQNKEPPKSAEPRPKFQRFRQKKFVCDECDRSFTMKQNVQQHFFQVFKLPVISELLFPSLTITVSQSERSKKEGCANHIETFSMHEML
ncbi:hypothetical protein ANCCAN_18374, partial [Ancylostoma caninum]